MEQRPVTRNRPYSIIAYRGVAVVMGGLNGKNQDKKPDLKCPECRATLKQRRTRKPDACEMICGGCGQIFDVCDLETVQTLKE